MMLSGESQIMWRVSVGDMEIRRERDPLNATQTHTGISPMQQAA